MYPNANIECHLCLQNLTKWVPITQVIHEIIIVPYSVRYLTNYLSMGLATQGVDLESISTPCVAMHSAISHWSGQ